MHTQPLHAVVLSHVPFEDLGSLEPELTCRGFSIETVDVSAARFPLAQALNSDLLVVLGGPIGVYDSTDYPFLTAEIECLRSRLAAGKLTLGICLGAQLIAAALGALVFPGTRGPEIGWFPLQSAKSDPAPAWFAPLLAEGLHVFHWHSDTFDLPTRAFPLARTDLYENQAFAVADFALALQFHPEVTESGLERWYVGHACELRQRNFSVPHLRVEAHTHVPALAKAAEQFWKLWLDHVL